VKLLDSASSKNYNFGFVAFNLNRNYRNRDRENTWMQWNKVQGQTVTYILARLRMLFCSLLREWNVQIQSIAATTPICILQIFSSSAWMRLRKFSSVVRGSLFFRGASFVAGRVFSRWFSKLKNTSSFSAVRVPRREPGEERTRPRPRTRWHVGIDVLEDIAVHVLRIVWVRACRT